MYCLLCSVYSLFCVLCIVCFVFYALFVLYSMYCLVSFPVLFVCICVLYCCHRVAIQLQLNIYHIYHIIKSRHILCSITFFFPQIVPFDIVVKRAGTGQATYDNMTHALYTLYN
jgi:hypothetical protein